jgi:RimJ/RimL family protein N-acetyltransferase
MGLRRDWPDAEQIDTPRLTLEPLRIEHAGEMCPVLDDRSLHQYIGGKPLNLGQLRARYVVQVTGHSPDGAQGWLNWIMRHSTEQAVVGTVQATLSHQQGSMSAEIAWIVASPYQRRGYATEAARAIVGWLRQQGVDVFTAHIHPEHEASVRVARRLGLTATDAMVDGETRWVSGGK